MSDLDTRSTTSMGTLRFLEIPETLSPELTSDGKDGATTERSLDTEVLQLEPELPLIIFRDEILHQGPRQRRGPVLSLR